MEPSGAFQFIMSHLNSPVIFCVGFIVLFYRALVELAKLEEEKARRLKAEEPEDPELIARIGVVKDGIYNRLKLLATWADLDDEQAGAFLKMPYQHGDKNACRGVSKERGS